MPRFRVVYTKHKTQKVAACVAYLTKAQRKVWHDGELRPAAHSARKWILTSEDGSSLSTIFSDTVSVGDELEFELYLVSVEEEYLDAAHVKSTTLPAQARKTFPFLKPLDRSGSSSPSLKLLKDNGPMSVAGNNEKIEVRILTSDAVPSLSSPSNAPPLPKTCTLILPDISLLSSCSNYEFFAN